MLNKSDEKHHHDHRNDDNYHDGGELSLRFVLLKDKIVLQMCIDNRSN